MELSVVANVVCRDGSWVAYDGRAERNGQIISENTVKAQSINLGVCVGYTGVLELAEKIIAHLVASVDETTIKRLKSNHVAECISQILKKSNYPADWYAQFVCTGINDEGNMASYTIDQTGEISVHIPSAEKPFCTCVLSSGEHGLQLLDYVSPRLQAKGLSNVAIIDGMTKFIHDVSLVDSSVNDNVSVIELRT